MSIGLPENETPLEQAPSLADAGILVVDDDPAFQLGLKTFLREYAGFEKVFTARSGDEALKLIDAEPSIQVVTLDNEMPGMTGIKMLTSLAESTPRPLSVVMITGAASPKLEKKFHQFGSTKLLANHYLAKPVAFEELEPVILRSYEELKSLPPVEVEEPDIASLIAEDMQKENIESIDVIDPTVPISPPGNRDDQLEELKIQLERNTSTINELNARIPTIEQRFWMGNLMILTAAVFLWMMFQLDGFSHAKKWFDQLKVMATPAELMTGTGETGTGANTVDTPIEAKEGEPVESPVSSPAKEPKPKKEASNTQDKKGDEKSNDFQPVTGPVEQAETKTVAKP